MATSAELKQNILNGGYDQAFAKLYGADTATVAAQRVRYVDMIDHFEENFGTGRTVCLYSAPGRTEIGGNHTDHNRGRVLAAAINLDTLSAVSARDDMMVEIHSDGYPAIKVDLGSLDVVEKEKGKTHALVRGVAARMAELGYKIGGDA